MPRAIRSLVLVLTLSLAALLPRPARAQDGPPGLPNTGEWTRQAAQFLKDELDLDSAQTEKVQGVFEGAIREAMKSAAQAWRPGESFDFEQMRAGVEDLRVKVTRDIAALLTPSQQREFEALVEDFDRRAQQWEQRRRGWEDPMLAFEPPPLSKKILMERVERALGLSPEELQVILPLVEQVIDKRIACQEARIIRRKDLTAAIEGGATPAEVQQRVREIRSTEQFEQLELLAAQQKLRDLLTIQQEVKLVTMGILD